jgi:predicted DNA-binding ribbon-helix-helix protein
MTATQDAEIQKRSVRISGHLTSVSLEGIFWQALKDIAVNRQISLNALVTEIDKDRTGNLSSALRVFVYKNTHHS